MKKVLLVCCAAAAFIAQCGFSDRSAGPVSTQDGKGSFTCKVSMATAPANVAKLSGYLFKVRDSLNGIVDTVYFNFVVSGSYATAQVNNLATGTWTTTVNAYNAQDSLLYTGTTWIDVIPGQMSYVSIRLGPAQGSVYFYVYWDTDTTRQDTTGAPRIVVQPNSLMAGEGDSVNLTVAATGSTPLTYTWEKSKNGGISFDTIQSQTNGTIVFTAQLSDSGTVYRCVVSNLFGHDTSNIVYVMIRPRDTVPIDTIQHWFSSYDTLKASETWYQTTLFCLPGDSLYIYSGGSWKVDANHNGSYGANGDTCHAVAGKAYVLPGYSKGALVGKIGANGMPFIIGAHFSSQVVDSGALYIVANEKLGSNGSFLKDNSGYLNVNSFIYR